jgi:hypothetical protein
MSKATDRIQVNFLNKNGHERSQLIYGVDREYADTDEGYQFVRSYLIERYDMDDSSENIVITTPPVLTGSSGGQPTEVPAYMIHEDFVS